MVGGKDYLTMKFSVMDYLLTNEVARQFTFDGKTKGTMPFKDKILAKIVKRNFFTICCSRIKD